MIVPFFKYHGTGNDFILIDDRSRAFPADNDELIAQLCDRRFGIGGDGLMLLRNKPGVDFEMLYFNADGKPGSMCGNGGRCIVQFAKDIGAVNKEQVNFIAPDGMHEAVFVPGGVKLHMKDVKEVEAGEGFFFLDTGSPHYVKFELNVEALDVYSKGRKIRYNERFAQEGTNVNFAEAVEDGIYVRTYERGVEDETYSCGTGVTACALVASLIGVAKADKMCVVHTRGGDLKVHFQRNKDSFSDIWLEGPATYVYKGEIDL